MKSKYFLLFTVPILIFLAAYFIQTKKPVAAAMDYWYYKNGNLIPNVSTWKIGSSTIDSVFRTSTTTTLCLDSCRTTWPADGTVTSVALTAPTGLTVSGSPVTTSGTLALTLASGYQMLTNTASSTWDNKWDLASSTIGVAYGGTGSTTLTGILKGNGTSMIATAIAGTDYIASETDPVWVAVSGNYLLTANAFTQAIASTTFVARNDWTTIDNYPTGCTNQFIRTIGDTLTCASVANTDLANSTIGLTSSGSITVGTSPISLGGTSALNLNMANANTWTALQTFSNATSTLFSATYASSTSSYFGTSYLPNLGTAAGTFLAVDAAGQIIATSTPTGTVYTAGDFLTLTGTDFDVDTGAIADGATTILSTADAIYDFVRTATSTMVGTSNIITVGTLTSGALGAGFTDVPVLQGGTGLSSFTANSLLYSNSDGTALAFVATSTLNIGGNAGTATALAADPTDCGANTWATTIAASGNLTCSAVTYAGITAMTSANFAGLISDETGTSKVVFDTSPTLITPILGYASSTQLTTTGSTYLATATGNVGIGTTTPQQNLHIESADGSKLFRIQQSGQNNAMDLRSGTSWTEWRVGSLANTEMLRIYHDGSASAFVTGNVGIGTTGPSQTLGVKGNINVGASSGTYQYANLYSMHIGYDGTNRFGRIQVYNDDSATDYGDLVLNQSGGNVGIGTTNPAYLLDVFGNLRVDGTITQTVDGGNKIIPPYFYPTFSYATSTAWTATTTIPLGTAFIGETWVGVQCFTDTGTLNVSFYDGTNRMDLFNASTTVGSITLNTNNAFTVAEKRYADIGTPANSPTKISCTIKKYY